MKLLEDEDKVPVNFWQPGYNNVRGLAKARKTGKLIVIAHGDTMRRPEPGQTKWFPPGS